MALAVLFSSVMMFTLKNWLWLLTYCKNFLYTPIEFSHYNSVQSAIIGLS